MQQAVSVEGSRFEASRLTVPSGAAASAAATPAATAGGCRWRHRARRLRAVGLSAVEFLRV